MGRNVKTKNVFSQAVSKVTETLTTVIAGESSSGTTEMTATAFVTIVTEFLSITQVDFLSVKRCINVKMIFAKYLSEPHLKCHDTFTEHFK